MLYIVLVFVKCVSHILYGRKICNKHKSYHKLSHLCIGCFLRSADWWPLTSTRLPKRGLFWGDGKGVCGMHACIVLRVHYRQRGSSLSIPLCVQSRSYPTVTRYFHLFSKNPVVSIKIPRACWTNRIPAKWRWDSQSVPARGLDGRRTFWWF